jgi:hypothetical protein
MPYVSESAYHELLLRDCEHDNLRAAVAELTARIGGGMIPAEKLIVVGEVAGWIEEIAKAGEVSR